MYNKFHKDWLSRLCAVSKNIFRYVWRPLCYTRRFVCTESECLAKKSLILQCQIDKMAVFYFEM